MTKQILNGLADIFFLQRDYAESVKLYKKMRELLLSQTEYAFVSYKLLLLGLVSGHVSGSLRELVYSFKKLGFPLVQLNFWTYLKTAITLLRSVALPLASSLPHKILREAERESRPQKAGNLCKGAGQTTVHRDRKDQHAMEQNACLRELLLPGASAAPENDRFRCTTKITILGPCAYGPTGLYKTTEAERNPE